jgi:hypothetical protein
VFLTNLYSPERLKGVITPKLPNLEIIIKTWPETRRLATPKRAKLKLFGQKHG